MKYFRVLNKSPYSRYGTACDWTLTVDKDVSAPDAEIIAIDTNQEWIPIFDDVNRRAYWNERWWIVAHAYRHDSRTMEVKLKNLPPAANMAESSDSAGSPIPECDFETAPA
jgi:hypothetical protein